VNFDSSEAGISKCVCGGGVSWVLSRENAEAGSEHVPWFFLNFNVKVCAFWQSEGNHCFLFRKSVAILQYRKCVGRVTPYFTRQFRVNLYSEWPWR